MKKYQIVELTDAQMHAGTKATADIAKIADSLGFARINIRMSSSKPGLLGKLNRQYHYLKAWKDCFNSIEDCSIVLLQHPFHYKQLTRSKTLKRLKVEKKVKFISLVHDVEELRGYRFSEYYKNEFQDMLYLADVIIVHNEAMKNWFQEKGIDKNKLITLEIFDYLQSDDKKEVEYSPSINIAGNLDTQKSRYIYRLGELKNVHINLYGVNYDEQMSQYQNIKYYGAFPADDVPKQLKSGFGLVWDGDSLESCSGFSGQYLKFNNPHKLSLYLSSGLPVVIWKKAAEAIFVQQNGVGYCVEDLSELNHLLNNEEEYRKMQTNAIKISQKLKSGHYARVAIGKSMDVIRE